MSRTDFLKKLFLISIGIRFIFIILLNSDFSREIYENITQQDSSFLDFKCLDSHFGTVLRQ